MNPNIVFLVSQSILFPLIIGLLRIKTVKKNYLPFFCNLSLGCLVEIISYNLIKKHHTSNAIPTNLFVLAEWLLLSYQFYQWGFFKKQKKNLPLLLAIPVSIWIIENVVFWKIVEFSPYFRVSYSFLLVLMSISRINFMITYDHKNLFRNPVFIICIGFIVYFIYQIIYEWTYQLSIVEPTHFTETISYLFGYMNALVNIIFGIAFLLIPVQRKFKLEAPK
jgi:hypothetical protein